MRKRRRTPTPTVTVSKGTLKPANFGFVAAPNGGVEPAHLNLTDTLNNLHVFQGESVTITAKPGANGGNGIANVGMIDATGVDLGKVIVRGNLGQIEAGSKNLPAPELGSLNVQSADFPPSVGCLRFCSEAAAAESHSRAVAFRGDALSRGGSRWLCRQEKLAWHQPRRAKAVVDRE